VRHLYSPGCREVTFSETELPACRLPGGLLTKRRTGVPLCLHFLCQYRDEKGAHRVEEWHDFFLAAAANHVLYGNSPRAGS
jgi:hypothetical protein